MKIIKLKNPQEQGSWPIKIIKNFNKSNSRLSSLLRFGHLRGPNMPLYLEPQKKMKQSTEKKIWSI